MLDNIAIHVPTPAEYDELMRVLEDKGYRWQDDSLPTKLSAWQIYKDETCIEFSGGSLGHCPRSWYEREGYKITPLKEALTLLNMDKTKICKENLVAGKTLIDHGNGEKSLVLEVGETSYLKSLSHDHARTNEWYTYTTSEGRGWKIYLPDETIEINGKKYKREEVNERLKELKEVE